MLDAMGVGALAPHLGRVGRKFFKTLSQGYKTRSIGPYRSLWRLRLINSMLEPHPRSITSGDALT